MFVVSNVSDIEMDKLRKTKSSIAIDVDQEKVFEVSNENIQDPHIAGTVVFRGHNLSKNCQIGMDEIALVMAAYPSSFQRTRTTNLGTFHMIKESKVIWQAEAWVFVEKPPSIITSMTIVQILLWYHVQVHS